MAFRVYEEDELITVEQQEFSLKAVLGKLADGGLETRLFYSLNRQEVYVKIRCPLQTLQKFAAFFDHKLPLDMTKLQEACEKGRDGLWDPMKIPVESQVTYMHPYQHVYCEYQYDPERRFVRILDNLVRRVFPNSTYILPQRL